MRVEKVEGAHVVMTGSDRFAPSVRFMIDATRTGDAWTINSVRYAPTRNGDKHFVTLTESAAADKPTDISLLVGKKTVIASGNSHAERKHWPTAL